MQLFPVIFTNIAAAQLKAEEYEIKEHKMRYEFCKKQEEEHHKFLEKMERCEFESEV